MDYNTLFTIYKNIPLPENFNDDVLCRAIISLDPMARESISAIILRYFINNPSSEKDVKIVDVMGNINNQSNILLPYGGISSGIGVTFSFKKFPRDLVQIIKAYVTLICEMV